MARHGARRARPAELVPGTVRVITARLDYWPARGARRATTCSPIRRTAYVSRYALGRDYHKVLRAQARSARRAHRRRGRAVRLSRLHRQRAGARGRARARKAGLGWRGKHTLLLTRDAGSLFLPRRDLHRPAAAASTPATTRTAARARACIDACPTRRDRRALRARRAPLHLLSHDRAQRRDSRGAAAADRQPHLRLRRLPARLPVEQVRAAPRRARLPPCATASTTRALVDALRVDARTSSTQRMAGSAIRRIGYERWLRNIAVALGNAPAIAARRSRRSSGAPDDPSPLVREHVAWALARHRAAADTSAGR